MSKNPKKFTTRQENAIVRQVLEDKVGISGYYYNDLSKSTGRRRRIFKTVELTDDIQSILFALNLEGLTGWHAWTSRGPGRIFGIQKVTWEKNPPLTLNNAPRPPQNLTSIGIHCHIKPWSSVDQDDPYGKSTTGGPAPPPQTSKEIKDYLRFISDHERELLERILEHHGELTWEMIYKARWLYAALNPLNRHNREEWYKDKFKAWDFVGYCGLAVKRRSLRKGSRHDGTLTEPDDHGTLYDNPKVIKPYPPEIKNLGVPMSTRGPLDATHVTANNFDDYIFEQSKKGFPGVL
jgi:hypothetical protein